MLKYKMVVPKDVKTIHVTVQEGLSCSYITW